MPVRIVDKLINITICNGGQSLVGATTNNGSHHQNSRVHLNSNVYSMVPHLHNDPFYCSPFGNPYFRWD